VAVSYKLCTLQVYTESNLSHAANDIMGEIKRNVFLESVRRPHHQGPVCRSSAPQVVGQCFTSALSGGRWREAPCNADACSWNPPQFDWGQWAQDSTGKLKTLESA